MADEEKGSSEQPTDQSEEKELTEQEIKEIDTSFEDGFKNDAYDVPADQRKPPELTDEQKSATAQALGEGEETTDTDPPPDDKKDEQPTDATGEGDITGQQQEVGQQQSEPDPFETRLRQQETYAGNLYRNQQYLDNENKQLREHVTTLTNHIRDNPPQAAPLNVDAALNKIKESDLWGELQHLNPGVLQLFEEFSKELKAQQPEPSADQPKIPDVPTQVVPEENQGEQQLSPQDQQLQYLMEAEMRRQIQPILEKHPTAMQDVETPQYQQWLAVQDDDTQAKARGNNPKDWETVLDKFYETKQKFAPTQQKQEQQKSTDTTKADRLKDSIPANEKLPTSANAMPEGEQKSEDPIQDEFERGFAEAA